MADACVGRALLTGFACHARRIPERVEPIGIVAQRQAGERAPLFEDRDFETVVREDQARVLLENNARQHDGILRFGRSKSEMVTNNAGLSRIYITRRFKARPR